MLGVAATTERPVIGLIGDLAFLHDLSGLVWGEMEVVPPATLVVVDNAGGGIFNFLAYPDQLSPVLFEPRSGRRSGRTSSRSPGPSASRSSRSSMTTSSTSPSGTRRTRGELSIVFARDRATGERRTARGAQYGDRRRVGGPQTLNLRASAAAYLATTVSISRSAPHGLDDLGQLAGRERAGHLVGLHAGRRRESAQPTLAAGTCSSLAIATMWHCGLPSMRRPGIASERTII